MDYAEMDGLALARLVHRSEVTPLELVDAAIARIERFEPVINALSYRAFDEARRLARIARSNGPFAGVPFLLKDFGIGVAGWPNTSGSRFCRHMVDRADTGLMRRYRATGIIPIGRSASSEFGVIGNVETALHGAVRNPWNPDHAAGGSSGGAAAAVAAGYVPIAHASDGLGSIRIPAACCGLVGMKPTRDRVPNLPDAFDYAIGLCTDHVLTRTVRDSAAMLDATGTGEPGSPYALPAKAGSYLDAVGQEPARLRIAWSAEAPNGAVIHPDVRAATEQVAHTLAALGHEVMPQPLKLDFAALHAARAPVSGANFAAGMERTIALVGREPQPGELEPLTELALARCRRIAGVDVLRGMQDLRLMARKIVRQFEAFDVYLSPVMAAPPPPIGHLGASVDPAELTARQIALFPFTALFNVTGQPSISLPLGQTADGLPVGMMFTARYADETTLFRLAGQLERALPWCERRPPMPWIRENE